MTRAGDSEDFFAEVERKQELLREQLSSSPIVEVTGLVDANGLSVGRGSGDQLWTAIVGLEAWRIGSGPIRIEKLILRRWVTEEQGASLRGQILTDSIIRFMARVSEDNIFESPQAMLEQIVSVNADDAELASHQVELLKPVTHQDEYFGILTFDRRVSWFRAEVTWRGGSWLKRTCIQLNLPVESKDELEPALESAKELWADQKGWTRRVRDYAVQELLDLKNGSWRDEAEKELTPRQFSSKMELKSISVYPDGSFEFWHDDGWLFGGHAIEVSGSLSAGLTSARIQG